MHDLVVSLAKVVTYALWAWVVFLMALAWVVWTFDPDGPWVLIATTSCASSAAAATAHIRLYCSRVCRLLRQGFGVTPPEGVRSLH